MLNMEDSSYSFDKRFKIIEAVLFLENKPLTYDFFKNYFHISRDEFNEYIKRLKAFYTNRGISLIIDGENISFNVSTELFKEISNVFKEIKKRRLSKVHIETLAIIAYHQPISKKEIDSFRKKRTPKAVFNILLDRNFIEAIDYEIDTGKKNKEIRYKTSKYFLEYFKLNSLKDLPKIKEIKEMDL